MRPAVSNPWNFPRDGHIVKDLVQYRFDYLVIGSGLAGLYAAFCASRHGSVGLLSKTSLVESSSYWAQGGIAAAIDPEDSAYAHLDDTIAAGRGLCREAAVEILCGEGVQRVRDLIEMGMPFDPGPHAGLALGLEGGHSRRRILHAGGNATGQEVVKFLLQRVLADRNITVFDDTIVAEMVVSDTTPYEAGRPRKLISDGVASSYWPSPATHWAGTALTPPTAIAASLRTESPTCIAPTTVPASGLAADSAGASAVGAGAGGVASAAWPPPW